MGAVKPKPKRISVDEILINIRSCGQSIKGPRETNEDAFFTGVVAGLQMSYHIAIVCDGAGGHAGGKFASNTFIEHIRSIVSDYANSGVDITEGNIQQIVTSANEKLMAESRNRGTPNATTTFSLVVTNPHTQKVITVSSGDSPIMKYKKGVGSIGVVGKIMNAAAGLLEVGAITAREFLSHPFSSDLQSGAGPHLKEISINSFSLEQLAQQGIYFLIGSDGLGIAPNGERYGKKHIRDMATSGAVMQRGSVDLKKWVDSAIQDALINQAKAVHADNVTAVAIDFTNIPFESVKKQNERSWNRPALLTLLDRLSQIGKVKIVSFATIATATLLCFALSITTPKSTTPAPQPTAARSSAPPEMVLKGPPQYAIEYANHLNKVDGMILIQQEEKK